MHDGVVRDIEGDVHEVRLGVYLTSEAFQSIAREVVRLEAENKTLKEASVGHVPIIASMAIGLLLGGAIAYLAARK